MNENSGRNRPWRLSTFSRMAWRRVKNMAPVGGLFLIALATALNSPAIGRDLSLPDAIGLAVNHSSAVSSARHDSTAAHLSYGAARALRFPEVSLTAASTFRNEVPSLDINLPPVHFQKQMGSKDTYQTDLEVSQMLFTGGRLSNGIRAERENSLAGGEALRAAEMAAAFDCREAYLRALASASAVAGAQASQRRLEIIRQDVENLFGSGVADSVDILEAELALERGRQAVADQMLAQAVALTRLCSLTGIDSSVVPVLTEPVHPPSGPLDPKGDTEIRRPEVRKLEHLERAASCAASIARADYFPNLVGFAAYSVGKPNQDLFHNEWNDYLMVGLRFTWGFNLADRTGRLAAAAAERARSARAARADLLDALEAARKAAIERADYSYGTVERSKKQLDLARRRFELAGERQKAGALSVNRLLETEAELTALDRAYQAALVGYYLAEAEYYFAVGSPEIFGGLR